MARIPVVAGAPQTVSATQDEQKTISGSVGSVSYENTDGSGTLTSGQSVTVFNNTTLTVSSGRGYVDVVDVAGAPDRLGAPAARQVPAWSPALGRFAWKDPDRYDVRDFGAVGSGSAVLLSSVYSTLAAAQTVYPFVTSLSQTLDYAGIQLAIETCGENGGGTVVIANTGSDYVLASADSRTVGSTKLYFHIWQDNTIVEGGGPGSSGIYAATTNTQAILFLMFKADELYDSDWHTSRVTAQTVYTLSGSVSAGAKTVTTSTASHAGNFAAGDSIFIRTGQTLGSGTTEPDSEINEVVSAVAGTGVITLKYPLAKSYAAENFNSGSSGISSVGGGGDACEFGVSNVTSRVLRDVGFRHLNATNLDTTRGFCNGESIDGYVIEGCNVTTASYFASQSATCRVKYLNNRLHCVGSGVLMPNACFGYGSVTCEVAGNVFSSQSRIFYTHIHEGSADVDVHNNVYLMPTGVSTASENVVSIRARNYNTRVRDNHIINSSTDSGAPVIYVDTYCPAGGEIDGNTMTGTLSSVGISTGSAGWKVGTRNKLPSGTTVTVYGGTSERSSDVQYMSAWVLDDDQTVTLGTLPAYHTVLGVQSVHVTEAFNSDGTDTLQVGIQGVSADAYLKAIDVSSTGTKLVPLTGSKTWDAGNIADGNMTSTTVTVTGAALGDVASASLTTAVPAGALLTANVTAANTVTVTLFNKTGGDLDLASGTLKAEVVRDYQGTSSGGYSGSERVVEATYTNGGSEPTTGKALVTLAWARSPVQP